MLTLAVLLAVAFVVLAGVWALRRRAARDDDRPGDGHEPVPPSDHHRVDHLRGLLAAVVESTDDAVISKSLEGRILSWNAGAESMFGYRPSEAVGASINLLSQASQSGGRPSSDERGGIRRPPGEARGSAHPARPHRTPAAGLSRRLRAAPAVRECVAGYPDSAAAAPISAARRPTACPPAALVDHRAWHAI